MIIARYMASEIHTDYLIIKFILGSQKLQDEVLSATCPNRTEEVFPELMRDLMNVLVYIHIHLYLIRKKHGHCTFSIFGYFSSINLINES